MRPPGRFRPKGEFSGGEVAERLVWGSFGFFLVVMAIYAGFSFRFAADLIEFLEKGVADGVVAGLAETLGAVLGTETGMTFSPSYHSPVSGARRGGCRCRDQ